MFLLFQAPIRKALQPHANCTNYVDFVGRALRGTAAALRQVGHGPFQKIAETRDRAGDLDLVGHPLLLNRFPAMYLLQPKPNVFLRFASEGHECEKTY